MPRREKPIDMSHGAVAELAMELRELRERAGGSPYRSLALKAGYSSTVLSQAAAGTSLPSWPVVRAFVVACDGDVDHWERRWHETSRAHASAAEPEADPEAGKSIIERIRSSADTYRDAEMLVNLLARSNPDSIAYAASQAVTSAPPVEDHLTSDRVRAYVAGELRPKDFDRAATHLVKCEECLRRTAAVRGTPARRRSPYGQQRTTVLLVDDHEVVRRGVRHVLRFEPDIEVIGEADTVRMAMVAAPLLCPDVIVLDLGFSDGDGITLCREIRAITTPQPACMILTSHTHDVALLGAVKAGASGYMLKQQSGPEIAAAVRHLAAGGSLLNPDMIQSAFERWTLDGRQYLRLNRREREVFRLVAQGLPNCEIAARLYLAEKTVKTYVSQLMRKLKVDRRAEVVLYAVRLSAGAW